MTMHQLATINNTVITSVSGINTKPSSHVELVSKTVNGTGFATLTGVNSTDNDISVIFTIVDSGIAALQPIESNNLGTLENVLYAGATDIEYLVTLDQDVVEARYSSARVGESQVRSILENSATNLITLTEDVSTLVHTPIYTLIGVSLKQGDSIFGDEVNFDGGISLDGAAPETSRRLSFGNDLTTVYSQFKTFSNGRLQYRLEPELLADIPDGTVVNEVTGGRTITISDGTNSENYTNVTSDKNFMQRIVQFSEYIQPLKTRQLNSDFNLGGSARLSEIVYEGNLQNTTVTATPNVAAQTATYKGVVIGTNNVGLETWEITSSLGVDTNLSTSGTYTDGNITFTINPSTTTADPTSTTNGLGFRVSYVARQDAAIPRPSIGVSPMQLGKRGEQKTVTWIYTAKPAVEFDYRNIIASGRINPVCLGDDVGLVAGIPQFNAALVALYAARKNSGVALTNNQGNFVNSVTTTVPGTDAVTEVVQAYIITYASTIRMFFIPDTPDAGLFPQLVNVNAVFEGDPGNFFGSSVTLSGGGLTAPVVGKIWNDTIPLGNAVNFGSIPFNFPGGTVTGYSFNLSIANSTISAVNPDVFVVNGNQEVPFTRITKAGTDETDTSTDTTIQTWTAQSADIALAEAIYQMMLFYLGRVANDAAAIADWTAIFNTIVFQIGNLLEPAGENEDSNQAYKDALEADFKLMLINNGILPDGFEASGCWQDYPQDRFHWVDKEGQYLPAHTNRLYVSAVLNEDGIAMSTQEFAFGIVVDGSTFLAEGDQVIMSFGDAPTAGQYSLGSSFLLNVKGLQPVLLSGGVDLNTVQIWSVSDATNIRKFARDTALATNPVFNDIAVTFEISQAIDYELGDFFRIIVNTLAFTHQIDSGTVSAPLNIIDQPIAASLNVEFNNGRFKAGDTWTYNSKAIYSASQVLKPDEFCHVSTGNISFTIASTGQYDLAVVAGTDGETVSFTNTTGTQNITVANGIAIARYTLPQSSPMTINVTKAAPSETFVRWVWLGESIKLDGMATTSVANSQVDRFGRLSVGYTLTWQNSSAEGDIKKLTDASREHRLCEDVPALLMPACERDDLATMVQLPTQYNFNHLTKFAALTDIGTMTLVFVGVEF